MKKSKVARQVQGYELTRQRLDGTPFDKASELKSASEEIRRRMWERLETARIFKEMSSREEFQFVKHELQEGLACRYGGKSDSLVRVYSEDVGVKIDVNEDLFKNLSASKDIVEAIIRSTADTFSKSYYQIKGILPSDGVRAEDLLKEMKRSQALKT